MKIRKSVLKTSPISLAITAMVLGMTAVSVPVLAETLAKPIVMAAANPCAAKNPCAAANPCAAKNPCAAANPCAAKNPCAAANPCAAKNPCAAANPCAAKNPCVAANPCAAANPCVAKNPCAAGGITAEALTRPEGTKAYEGEAEELLAYGKQLWEDKSLSASGALSCATCHSGYNTLTKSFALPYPHKIAMVQTQIGVDMEVDVEQIVQFCMMSPMQAKPLAWDSKELAALSAFVVDFQKGYTPK